MGPVEHHCHHRLGFVQNRRGAPYPVGRHLAGGLEPESLQQHSVGHEAHEVLEVLRATVDQIAHGLVQ